MREGENFLCVEVVERAESRIDVAFEKAALEIDLVGDQNTSTE